MASKAITVVGDAALDVFTLYDGTISNSASRSGTHFTGAKDKYVPSGVKLTQTALETLLQASCDCTAIVPTGGNGDKSEVNSYTTQLMFLDRFGSATQARDRLRIRSMLPLDDAFPPLGGVRKSKTECSYFCCGDADKRSDLIVIDDWGPISKSRKCDELTSFLAERSKNGCPIIVNIGSELPPTCPGGETSPSQLWSCLSDDDVMRAGVCVVVSATRLREAGAAISRRLSWEQTVEDVLTESINFDPLRFLCHKFNNIIIRFGISGAIHFHKRNMCAVPNVQFAFMPRAKDGIVRDPVDDGQIIGKNAVMVAALAQQLLSSSKVPDFAAAMRTALHSMLRLHNGGFDASWEHEIANPQDDLKSRKFLKLYFQQALQPDGDNGEARPDFGYFYNQIRAEDVIGVSDVPNDIVRQSRDEEGLSFIPTSWSILNDCLEKQDGVRPQPTPCRESIGMAIVKYGLDAVLNTYLSSSNNRKIPKLVLAELSIPPCRLHEEDREDAWPTNPARPPYLPIPGKSYYESLKAHDPQIKSDFSLFVPVLKFGDLVTVDRKEIESFRSIRNLIKSYVEAESSGHGTRRPISIAVFGPPGAGKSFAVKQIAKSINDSIPSIHKKIAISGYNVAQFKTVDDLSDALMSVGSVNNEGKIPMVFFDEFDCASGTEKLGWIKYFLSPMQDGEFYGKQTISMGSAIFVFAGGLCKSFEDFVPPAPPAKGGNGIQFSEPLEIVRARESFADHKGPDFVSRLRGFIDIQPMDSEGGAPVPVIRRSIVIRGLVEKNHIYTENATRRIAMIDDDVIYALLTVDKYNHGTRSIEAVLQMCSKAYGRIEKASLPSIRQLNMHVNSEHFYRLMRRSRVRRSHFVASHGEETFQANITPDGAEIAPE